jgi:hypothetical protein
MRAMRTDVSILADVHLKNLDGEQVRLGDLWSDQPVVVVWLRHYG